MLVRIDVPNDGLVFDQESGHEERIKKNAVYQGVRIHFNSLCRKPRERIQLGVAFGHVVHPRAYNHEWDEEISGRLEAPID